MTIVSRLRRSPFAFPVAALAALAMLFISETSHWRSRSALDEVSDLSATRLRVQRLLLNVVDAETAQRGYLLSGRKEYLEPYRNAIESLPIVLERLATYSAGHPDLQPSMKRLEELIAEKLSELATTMQLSDDGQAQAALDLMLTNIGKERMDAIRAAAEQILAEQAKDSAVAREKVADSLLFNRIGVSAMTALSLLALLLYLSQTRALDEQQRQQQLAIQAERDHLEIEVASRTADLTDLSRHLLTAREDERGRLARDLHDELGALFTAAKLDVARLKTRMAPVSPEAAERLAHLNEMLNAGIALKRRIIEDLRPSSLSNLGLIAALENLVQDVVTRSELQVDCDLQKVALSPASELTVYRLVQEALTNIVKYAKARRVQVTLLEHEGRARVQVTDDGVGFDPKAKKPSTHGLLGMHYRVEADGGALALHSVPGQGTLIEATLPLSAPA